MKAFLCPKQTTCRDKIYQKRIRIFEIVCNFGAFVLLCWICPVINFGRMIFFNVQKSAYKWFKLVRFVQVQIYILNANRIKKTFSKLRAYTEMFVRGKKWIDTLKKSASNLYAPPPVAHIVVDSEVNPFDLASCRNCSISEVGNLMKCNVPTLFPILAEVI